MAENSIEILGQKISYPSTWQGTTAVFSVCLCIGFLGWTLEGDQINAFGKVFNGHSEQAYNQSLQTIEKQNKMISSMQVTIDKLTSKAKISQEEKNKITERLKANIKDIESSLQSLSQIQQNKKSEFKTKDNDLTPYQKDYLLKQEQQIQQQIQQLQQQQQK